MNIFSILSMLFFTIIPLVLTRSLASYKKTSKLRYISLENKFLTKLLIPKGSGYVKVNDRKKISLFSLIFYILFGVLLFVLVILFVSSDIPCEPFIAHFGKRGQIKWTINTLNEKLIFLLPIIFFLVELIAYFLIGIPRLIKSKTESRKSLLGLLTVFVIFVGFLVFFIVQLFL